MKEENKTKYENKTKKMNINLTQLLVCDGLLCG